MADDKTKANLLENIRRTHIHVTGAYHEAGHALGYMACEREFLEIDLKWDCVRVVPSPIDGYSRALTTWAGPLAEYRYSFPDPEEFEERWGHYCNEYMTETAEYLDDLKKSCDEDEFEEALRSDCAQLLQLNHFDRKHGLRDAGWMLDAHWDALERLVRALLNRGVVTYAEAVEIVGHVEDWLD